MHTQSIRSLIQALQSRQLSSVELVEHYLSRIQQAQSLNAFISIDEKYAKTMAKQADVLLKKGNAPLFTGIPMAHKDNFCTKIMPTTCASKMLANFVAPYDATVVKKLADHGSIMLGKTNMDEFAMGATNETSYFGPVKNPWNQAHVAGGSSGGSAAAVAARLVPFATGTDTGGSIRQPAAFSGISGLKPTYGLVSRFGQVAYASSLDQAGILAPSAEDIALTLQAIVGFDEKDSTSINQAAPKFIDGLNKPITPLRIGLPSSFFSAHVDKNIQKALREAIKLFEEAGAEIVEIDLTLMSYWMPCYNVIATAEASSNLARFDGIRFGYQAEHAQSIKELIARSRSEGFGMQVKRRILTGTYVLSSEKFDDYYLHAQKVRQLIANELQEALSKVDIILGPTTLSSAFKLGETDCDSPQYQLADMFTVAVNLAGVPAMSIPIGFNQDLPMGMQLIGNYFSEARLLQLAHFYQQCTNWHKAIPTLGDSK
ncbi:MAG: Asp-tRNA(Asn)/Glu-tRNA(Gln) amidotransferase subunit GatA [Legionellaceae bacterium]|nr:Asp-tRNA(Asn)/Glu-tRNA(Gln) amidotransferase subunit GatA [Legionellaceae bacterium]